MAWEGVGESPINEEVVVLVVLAGVEGCRPNACQGLIVLLILVPLVERCNTAAPPAPLILLLLALLLLPTPLPLGGSKTGAGRTGLAHRFPVPLGPP